MSQICITKPAISLEICMERSLHGKKLERCMVHVTVELVVWLMLTYDWGNATRLHPQ